MLEHGGNLDLALQHYGGQLEDWIDLSTGINRQALSNASTFATALERVALPLRDRIAP